MDFLDDSFGGEVSGTQDPDADFLQREQAELGGLGLDLGSAGSSGGLGQDLNIGGSGGLGLGLDLGSNGPAANMGSSGDLGLDLGKAVAGPPTGSALELDGFGTTDKVKNYEPYPQIN